MRITLVRAAVTSAACFFSVACHSTDRPAAPNEPAAPSPSEAASSNAEDGGPELAVLTYNVNFGNVGDAPAIAAIRDANADLVILQETNGAWERALVSELGELYPHHEFRPATPSIAGGLGILSKRPLHAKELMPSPVGWFAGWRVIADTSIGALQVLDVHLRPQLSDPDALFDGYFSTRSDRAEEIAAYARVLDPSLPTVVAGDFNETEDGRAIGFLADRGMRSALPDFAPDQRTWHWFTKVGEISTRLDHVVYEVARLRAVAATVLEKGGSDHFPVLVKLRPVST
jgi:endonuclease/exonuclease/phosphatase (EEP) superfamily protein YafD